MKNKLNNFLIWIGWKHWKNRKLVWNVSEVVIDIDIMLIMLICYKLFLT